MLVFREKHGVIRKDFLDCMIELRNKGKKVIEEDKTSGKGRNKNSNFGKLTEFSYKRLIT
jgi:hypothetical protein